MSNSRALALHARGRGCESRFYISFSYGKNGYPKTRESILQNWRLMTGTSLLLCNKMSIFRNIEKLGRKSLRVHISNFGLEVLSLGSYLFIYSHILFLIMDNKTQGLIQIVFAISVIMAVFLLGSELEKFKELGYLGLFIISILSSATVLVPGPGRFVALAMGRALDPITVGIIGGVGSAIGELTGYVAGHGASEMINANCQFKKYKKWIEKYDVAAIFVLALIPNPLFDIAGLAAGALKIPWWRYFIATAAGRIISFAVLAYLGKLSLAYLPLNI